MNEADYLAKIRDAHRRLVRFEADFNFDVEHEKAVLARVLSAHRGEEDPPQSHWHADAERGMCTECDAAGAIALVALEGQED